MIAYELVRSSLTIALSENSFMFDPVSAMKSTAVLQSSVNCKSYTAEVKPVHSYRSLY